MRTSNKNENNHLSILLHIYCTTCKIISIHRPHSIKFICIESSSGIFISFTDNEHFERISHAIIAYKYYKFLFMTLEETYSLRALSIFSTIGLIISFLFGTI